MSNLNLEFLLSELDCSAGLEKSASATNTAPIVDPSKELKDILEKRASVDLVKQAQEAGAKVAKELLAKMASDANLAIAENAVSVAQADQSITPTSQGTAEQVLQDTVAKQVQRGAQSEDRVDPILDKQANQITETESDMTSQFLQNLEKLAEAVGAPDVANVSTGATPNLVQAATQAQVAFDDAKVNPTPGTEGNVNAVIQSIVAKFQAKGAGSENLVDGQPPVEGAQVANDEIEKAAAVAYLTEAGYDFDSAVEMVKEAEFNMEKEAAFESLTEAGYDFDTAVEMIKEAAAMEPDEILGRNGETIRGKSTKPAGLIGKGTTKAGWKGRLSRLAKNPVARGVAGVAALGTAGAAGYKAFSGQEKKAALDELMEAGIDFDQAMDLIKEASEGQKKTS